MRRVRPRTRRARPSARPSAGAGRGGCPQCWQRAAPSAIAGSGQPPRPALCPGSPLGKRGQRADPPPSGAPAGVDQPVRAARPAPCPPCVRCCARAKAARGMRRVRREATRWAKCGRLSCSCRSTSAAQCRSAAAALLVRHRVAPVKLVAAGTAVQERNERATESFRVLWTARTRSAIQRRQRTPSPDGRSGAASEQGGPEPSERQARQPLTCACAPEGRGLTLCVCVCVHAVARSSV